ncbi:DUF2017 domain-containing protein [Streptomyces qinzhouensis]|uniref:DUF2017 domain-containing protein n=1 Tax=Streptomyces qinzhouensis TaxID=2599401 RepID=A0A5B8J584_9ACTN|nr:DUF2017 domain-containing protein [Streptomyces qinzhouensis]QDY76935.1 DUF2017 domain-containing protein [Streptomyces qinzhouensis]
MPGPFEPVPGGGAAIDLDDVEVSILRSLAVQMLELIGPGDEPVEGEDPLAALFAEGPSEPPDDPALARLFPDAYSGPDRGGDTGTGPGAGPGSGPGSRPAMSEDERRAASAEFRRFTENDLRAGKRANALAVVHALDGLETGGGSTAELRLTPDECRQWLCALNDLRLTIGTRLEISEEDDAEGADGTEGGGLYHLPDDDPRKPMVMAYLWLGVLQETLVGTVLP